MPPPRSSYSASKMLTSLGRQLMTMKAKSLNTEGMRGTHAMGTALSGFLRIAATKLSCTASATSLAAAFIASGTVGGYSWLFAKHDRAFQERGCPKGLAINRLIYRDCWDRSNVHYEVIS